MRIYIPFLAIALMVSFSACGSTSDTDHPSQSQGQGQSQSLPDSNQAGANTPVTIRLADYEFSDSQWANIEKLVSKKFPNMIVNRIVHHGDDGNDISSLVVAKETPDVILQPSSVTSDLTNLGLLFDLSPYVKKYNVDLSQIPSTIIDSAKAFSVQNQLTMLPLDLNMTFLLYNKDIFDKAGISYPTDHMTYGDLLKLAQRLTRSVDGKTVAGYIPQFVYSEANQMGLTILDQNNKSLLDKTPGFKTVFQWNKELFSIPGMQEMVNQNFRKAFFSEDAAMITEWMINLSVTMSKSPPSFQWGAASQVYWEDTPGWTSFPDFHAAYVTSSSTHKDEAFQLISFLSTSEEIQSLFAKQGLPPTMTNDPKVLNQFGADIPAFNSQRDRLIEIMKNTKYTPIRKINPWDHDTKAVINPTRDIYNEIVNGAIDVNTGLKQLSDTINAGLADKPVSP